MYGLIPAQNLRPLSTIVWPPYDLSNRTAQHQQQRRRPRRQLSQNLSVSQLGRTWRLMPTNCRTSSMPSSQNVSGNCALVYCDIIDQIIFQALFSLYWFSCLCVFYYPFYFLIKNVFVFFSNQHILFFKEVWNISL